MSFDINSFRKFLQDSSKKIEQDYTEPIRLREQANQPPGGGQRDTFTTQSGGPHRSMGGGGRGGGIGGIDNRPKDDDGLEPDWYTLWSRRYLGEVFACGTDTACLNNIPYITCGIDGCFFGVEPYWRQFYPPSGPCNDFGCMW